MASDQIKWLSIYDDFSNLDVDTDSLYQKFIQPIENYRSNTVVNVYDKQDDSKNPKPIKSNSEQTESRAHAFYRMLGLPVIASDSLYYNPGFPRSANISVDKNSVKQQVSKTVTDMQATRERGCAKRKNIFKNGMKPASLYSLMLSLLRIKHKFQVMDKFSSWNDKDLQNISVEDIKKQIIKMYKNTSDGSTINMSEFPDIPHNHILRPLTTDPVICENITPPNNIVCSPFLKENSDTEIDRNVFLKRPGIEFILRLRLKQQQVPITDAEITSFFELSDAAFKNGTKSSSDPSYVVDPDKYSFSLSETTTVKLLRTIKGLVREYVEHCNVLERLEKELIWVPMCSESGPENGTTINASFIKQESVSYKNNIDVKIENTTVDDLIATRQQDLNSIFNNTGNNTIDYSSFTISEFNNVESNISKNLARLKSQRNSKRTDASNRMKAIEIITGEVSGLGLIDVLAIYAALWSVDVTVLLGLLDTDALSRLKTITTLNSPDIQAAVSGNGMTVTNAIQALEDRVIVILNEVDNIMAGTLHNAANSHTGTVISK
jgi:hypothetical protein